MTATISFVIPVLNEAARIGALLAKLRERYPDAELVVIDGGSSDATVASVTPTCDQLLSTPAGRALQMNAGAAQATGDYLFFLHADTSPVISQARLSRHLAEQPAWGFSLVRLGSAATVFRVIEWFMNHRSQLTRVATGDQMLFVRRDVFHQIGGYDNIPLMEDVALCKRLRRIATPKVLPEPAVSSSRRWEERGVLRTVLLMWCLRLGYVLGVSPQTLWRFYYGR